MQQLLIDIECFTNYFLLGCKDYKTKETFSFEITDEIDQRKELYEFLKSYNGFWISFNGIHYDNMVLAFGQSHRWFENLTATQCLLRLKEFSDKVIRQNDDDRQYLSKYKYFKWQFTNIDLYLYWAKLLRLSKKISLKSLGIQMGYPVVQELPHSPETILDIDQIQDIKVYNLEHDLGILELLTQQFEGKGSISLGALGTIQLREQVVKDYKIDAWSMDGPKIASEVLLQDYCKITGKDKDQVRKLRFDRPTIKFGELFEDLNVKFELLEIQQVYVEWCESVDTFSKEFVTGTRNHPIKISVGVGGIHSINTNETYASNEDYTIITDDIISYYTTNIENWNAFRFPELLSVYSSFKTKRVTETKPGMKKHSKGSPEWVSFFQQDLFYKLILNGVSGFLDMEHSWLFNPPGIMKVRCGGQLILLTLIEKCIINDIAVISCNTDGLEVLIPNGKMELYLSLVKDVELQFNVQFEREKYNRIIYSSVNEYIAELENGQLKKKGSYFITQPELGNGTDFLIIPKLLEQYFINGIRPEVELQNPKYHIYDFCGSQKCDRSFTVQWNGVKQQRLNRYYVSTKGAYLYKCKEGKKHHMLKGWGVQLYNNHVEQDLVAYNIDYSYYLSEVKNIIAKIERLNQLTLF